MEWFLRSNSTLARILRTITQGILSVLLTEIPSIVGLFNIPLWAQSLIIAVLMAILSAVMAELGKYVEQVNGKKRLAAIQQATSEVEERKEVLARGFIEE